MAGKIHLNQEWITGFIQGLFCQLDTNIGPFLSSLQGYTLLFDKQENGLWKITISYGIISDSRDLETHFELGENSLIEAFRIKVELAVEEIISRIKRFDDKSFANENNEQ